MKKIYFITLMLLLALTSCEQSSVSEMSGSTSLDEQIDYSTFLAKVVDDFAEQSVATKAVSIKHIGFVNNSTPELALVLDNNSVIDYTYDATAKKYVTEAKLPADAKAQYMYSTSTTNNDALVGATWPTEFNAQKNKAVELYNLKSRVVVSYKYLASDIAEQVSEVKIGNIHTASKLEVVNNSLLCVVDGNTKGELVATEVVPNDDVEELEDTYNYGTREVFVAPQTLTSYDSYMTFVIDGKEYQYKFVEDLPLLANRRYKLLFEIGKSGVEPAISLEVTTDESVKSWDDSTMSLAINPATYQWSEWDGATYEALTDGDGTLENPFLINSAAQLAFVMQKCDAGTAAYLNNKHYRLMINIDWKSGSWAILGKYGNQITGSFDGNNKTIKNINVSTLGGNVGFIGLCGQNYSLKDLTLVNANFKAEYTSANPTWGSCVGGFIGNMPEGSVVENCHLVDSKISGNYYIGGIVGSSSGSVIGCSVVNSSISALYDENHEDGKVNRGAAGGIVGIFYSSTGKKIHYCLSADNEISGNSSYVGGILGLPWTQFPELVRCYATNLTTKCPEGKIYGLSALANQGAAGDFTVNANWVISSFHSVEEIAMDAADRYYPFASSTDMANKLNNAVPFSTTPAAEGWMWQANVIETRVPTPVRTN